MNITVETIITLSKIIGAAGIILGVIAAFIKWLSKQEKQSLDIEKLHKCHDEDLKSVQEELCVVNYAVLASLDALIQRGYGGNVAEAHGKLQKHINNKAHKQKGE
ncbi:MAG: branched-chain amino acid ABC transporter permease [Ruminococcaceae bacterium]|nr:branched-chain amino acid ABC transporter permease [Oscillospiraceae bacterium]